MSAMLVPGEKRHFGRRQSNIRGVAVVPGGAPQPFAIRNISDGGALLVFDEPFIPKRTFRIEIADTDFVLLCEVCHQGPQGVGVRFMRAAEGAALNRHFQLRPVEGHVGAAAPSMVASHRAALPVTSNRDLRRALQVASAPRSTNPEPGVAASDAPAAEAPAAAPVQSSGFDRSLVSALPAAITGLIKAFATRMPAAAAG